MTQDARYAAVVMTDQGQPVAAMIDVDAFEKLQPALNILQALRDAGELPTPPAWLALREGLVEWNAEEAGGRL